MTRTEWDNKFAWIRALSPTLSTRVVNCIAHSGANSLADLAMFTRREFSYVRDVGKKTILEVEEALAEHGLAFKSDLRCPRCGHDPDEPAALVEAIDVVDEGDK